MYHRHKGIQEIWSNSKCFCSREDQMDMHWKILAKHDLIQFCLLKKRVCCQLTLQTTINTFDEYHHENTVKTHVTAGKINRTIL